MEHALWGFVWLGKVMAAYILLMLLLAAILRLLGKNWRDWL